MDAFTSFVGTIALLAGAAWVVTRMLTPSNVNGNFLRFNSDLGWPHGVQEDDDFRWNWDRSTETPVAQPAKGDPRPPARPVVASSFRVHLAGAIGIDPEPREGEILDSGVSAVAVQRVDRRR